MHIRVVDLFGDAELFHRLPSDAVVGGDRLPLGAGMTEIGDLAGTCRQPLEIIVVVRQAHIGVGVANVAVHRDVPDAGAL